MGSKVKIVIGKPCVHRLINGMGFFPLDLPWFKRKGEEMLRIEF